MSEEFVKVKVFDVVNLMTPYGPVPAILLEDEQERILPILVGEMVAVSIKSSLTGQSSEGTRDTWELMHNIVAFCKGEIEKAVIYGIEENRFLAKMYLKHGSEMTEIECRPSDLIALAIRSGCPILISSELMDSMSINKSQLLRRGEEEDKESG
ncbi:MAG: bifunctional nuclease family protein [Candidatus Baldrarchaeia archaeon]